MPDKKPNKIAVTIRLSPENKQKLNEVAASENRTVTNWLENQIYKEWDKLNKTKPG